MKTKTLTRLIAIMLMAIVFAVSHQKAYAQGPYPAVSINSTTEFVLDTVSPLSDYYEGSLTALNFTSQSEADDFFGSKTDNLIGYQVDFAAQTVIIHLSLAYAPAGWTITEWNSYIDNKLNP